MLAFFFYTADEQMSGNKLSDEMAAVVFNHSNHLDACKCSGCGFKTL
jgi:hypothetical protein